ncbi:hypothetical protein [Nocardiopsis rhodophaea]|uniref:hypothetical protein n=1 Tax=Nocardiopsis rhodophaea TaxID=280238 RepID=UPI0031DF0B9F
MTPQRRTLITTATLIAATVVAVIAALAQGTLASLPGIAGLLTTVAIAAALMYTVLVGITPSKAAFTIFILGWAVIALGAFIGASVETHTRAQMFYSSMGGGTESTDRHNGSYGWLDSQQLIRPPHAEKSYSVQYPANATGSSDLFIWFSPYGADSTSTVLGWLVGIAAAATYSRARASASQPTEEKGE